jgi:hypothetical protein
MPVENWLEGWFFCKLLGHREGAILLTSTNADSIGGRVYN